MKVKIIQRGHLQDVEENLNKWLQKNDDVDVRHVTQSLDANGLYLVLIFYVERKGKKVKQ